MPNEVDAVQITDNFIKKWAKSLKPKMSFNAKDRLWIEVFPGEHSFSGKMAFKFFETHLKNEKK